MAIYVYYISNGALNSWCPNDTDPVAPPAVLAAQGLTSVSGLPPLDDTHVWSPAQKTVVVVAAPTPINLLNTYDFIMAFTAAELAAIRGATTDNNVQQFLYAMQVTQGLNLNSTTITNALTYLVNHAFLTQARANAILATVNGNAASGSGYRPV